MAKDTKFKPKDITGLVVGRLTALEPTSKRNKNNGSVIWTCKCECGNIVEIAESYLHKAEIRSCGCLGSENSSENMKKALTAHLEKHIVEGTNLQVLGRKKLLSSNTSGVTGVMWDKSRKKWKAEITFKGTVYKLGRFENKEDAIKARKDAEEKYHKPFLEEHYNKIGGQNNGNSKI